MNCKYPLEPKNLIDRYRQLIEMVSNRRNGTFIGIPKSAKSGYLKFLLEDKVLLSTELGLDLDKHLILFIEPYDLPDVETFLYQQIIARWPEYSHKSKNYKISRPEFDQLIQRITSESRHVAILLMDSCIGADEKYLLQLKRIVEISRTPPNNPVSIVLLTYFSSELYEKSDTFSDIFENLLLENVIYFKALSRSESEYSLRRLISLYKNYDVKEVDMDSVMKFTGGLYPYVQLIAREFTSSEQIDPIFLSTIATHKIDRISSQLWNHFSISQKKELITNSNRCTDSELRNLSMTNDSGAIQSVWLSDFIKGKVDPAGIRQTIRLTETEEKLLKSFHEANEKTLSREEISKILWNENYAELYSEWAIDKHIQRLRKKLQTLDPEIQIVTHKKHGYAITTL